MGRASLFLTAIEVVALSLIRREALLIMVVTLSVPAAVATAYSLLPAAAEEQAAVLMNYFSGREFVEVSGGGSVEVFIGTVKGGNASVEAYVVFADEGSLGTYLPVPGSGCGEAGAPRVSLGPVLASMLGVGRGDSVEVCAGGWCGVLPVGCVNRGGGLFRVAAIVVGEGPGVRGWSLGVSNSSSMVEGLMRGFSSFLRGFSAFVTLFIAVAYLPVTYFGVRRALSLVGDSVAVLTRLGVPRSVIRSGLFVSSALLAFAAVLFGLGLGVVMAHFGAWAAGFFGLVVSVRPLPSVWVAGFVTGLLFGEGLAASAIAVLRGGVRWPVP